MNTPLDVMIDCETLGTKPGSAVLEISAATFRAGDCKTVPRDRFHVEIDLLSSIACGLTVDAKTAEFHLSKEFDGHLRGRPLAEAALRLTVWIMEHAPRGRVWAWGMDFERSIIEAAFAPVNFGLPWMFYQGSDARTVWDLAFPGVKHPPRKHRADDDVADQIRDLNTAIAKLLAGGVNLEEVGK